MQPDDITDMLMNYIITKFKHEQEDLFIQPTTYAFIQPLIHSSNHSSMHVCKCKNTHLYRQT